jgi:hypothetical protein
MDGLNWAWDSSWFWWKRRKSEAGHMMEWAETEFWALELFSDLNKGFDFEIKGFKYFQTEFELRSKLG